MAQPHLVVAGASGIIGRNLVAAARHRYRVTVLTRDVNGSEPEGAEPLAWNPGAAADGDEAHLAGLARTLEGAAALVNLAGAPIHKGRFGRRHKHRIVDSRVHATSTLVQAAQRCERPPAVWLQGSGAGYYGDRGEEKLREGAPRGQGIFLADACAAWEAAAHPAGERSRLVIARQGIVLHREAPAWQRMLLPIRLGAAGPWGGGRQWYPWIHGEDATRAQLHLLETASAEGIYNLAAPEPVRQVELARSAARRLGRPALFPTPKWVLRLALGGLADNLVLPSARLLPARLQRDGFTFLYPDAEAALDELLGG